MRRNKKLINLDMVILYNLLLSLDFNVHLTVTSMTLLRRIYLGLGFSLVRNVVCHNAPPRPTPICKSEIKCSVRSQGSSITKI